MNDATPTPRPDIKTRARGLQEDIHLVHESVLTAIRWQTEADTWPDEVTDDDRASLRRALLNAVHEVEQAETKVDRLVSDAVDGRIVDYRR